MWNTRRKYNLVSILMIFPDEEKEEIISWKTFITTTTTGDQSSWLIFATFKRVRESFAMVNEEIYLGSKFLKLCDVVFNFIKFNPVIKKQKKTTKTIIFFKVKDSNLYLFQYLKNLFYISVISLILEIP